VSEILFVVCDVCGKRQECPGQRMPRDWFRVRSFSYDVADPDGSDADGSTAADVEGDACSRDCSAALLRKALTMIAYPETSP
jgi:hypothetical protein